MGTRSAIGYLQPSGSVRAVYCHWDGYPSHQEPILNKRYNSLAKVKALIKPGSMSSLETKYTWILHEEREPQPLYHCERGFEVGYSSPPITSNRPLDTWFKEHDCEYLYVWDGSKWITYSKYFPDQQ